MEQQSRRLCLARRLRKTPAFSLFHHLTFDLSTGEIASESSLIRGCAVCLICEHLLFRFLRLFFSFLARHFRAGWSRVFWTCSRAGYLGDCNMQQKIWFGAKVQQNFVAMMGATKFCPSRSNAVSLPVACAI